MRHLKQYNESISPTYLKLIEYFISKILEYKSDKITNIKLINSEWEVRFGYADRKSISFDNKISNKQETIDIEANSTSLRIFWNGSYRSDIAITNIAGYDRGVDRTEKAINHIFDGIIKSSNEVVEYFKKMSIADETLNKLTNEIIMEHFHDIIDASNGDYVIKKEHERSKFNYTKNWSLTVNLPTVFQKASQGISRDGFSITFNDDNTSLMESITTASHRLKDDNIIICAQFYSQHIIIDLHAMDENGKKI